MIVLNVKNLTKYYGSDLILNNINLTLTSTDKMAIIGRNGAGKSTLAKIICGLEDYDQGEIYIAAGMKLGYFSQESTLNSELTIFEELQTVFQKQLNLKDQLQTLEKQMSEGKNIYYDFYTKLLLEYEEQGGYLFEYQIETMLNKFGFQGRFTEKVSHLSGGEKTRLALAKLLLDQPDILVLDEPTNNLDLETLEYLESFLKTYKNSIIMISHDRYFINQIANAIYEIELTEGSLYQGNYDAYLEEKDRRYQSQKKQYELQQKLIQKEQEFINKNIVRASTTKRAQARQKKLEKLELIKNPKIDAKNINLKFDINSDTGNIVLEVNDLAIGYDKPFVEHINFLIEKGERVAILGSNGTGKSTLLKTLNQVIPQLKGRIRYGARVEIAYFDQDLALLNSDKTVLAEIWDEHPAMLEKDIRKHLGNFLFTGDDVYKVIRSLSGGEKVRLALAKLALLNANFLILDEVTNHLDILSREVLESELLNFPGTILFVSHDRFFIKKLATRVFAIRNKRLIQYNGDYEYYLEKKQQEELPEVEEKKNSNNNYELLKRIRNEQKRQEKLIAQLELDIKQLEQEISELLSYSQTEEVYSDYKKAQEVHQLIETKQQELDEKIHTWIELME